MSDGGMSDAEFDAKVGFPVGERYVPKSKLDAAEARATAAERERDHYRKLAFGRIDQSAANGWMPIACAPTNGSKIDLWSESHYGNGRIPDAWYVGNEWFVLNGNGRPEAIAHHHNVTHWRPIHALTANHSAPVVEE